MAVTERRRLRWIDAPLPTVLLLFGLAGTAGAFHNQNQTATPLAFALVVVAALALVAWRVRPLWSLAIASGATTLYLLLGYAYGPILFSLAAAALGAALWLPLRRAVLAISCVLAVVLIVSIIGLLARTHDWTVATVTSLLAVPVWLVIPAAVGVAIRTRREAGTEVRAARARRAVSEERLRLAQEVHDVAGHGFAVIAMQAGVALRVLDRDPAAVRATLEGIRDASREALAGLRAEVEALQSTGPRRPRSGLADLPALLERMRATGLPVALDPLPSTVEIPAEEDHAAYRIVQEALTNVLRHAGPEASAVVSVRTRGPRLLVTVRDDGRTAGAAEPAAGQGIAGMRRRAESVGGTLAAGPAAGGGFIVEATLPLAAAERPASPPEQPLSTLESGA